MRFTVCVAFCAAVAMSVEAPVSGQGTRADYDRANHLRDQVTGKVSASQVKPNWIGKSSRFWYRSNLAGGRSEYVLVDAAVPSKTPAFDHARLAAALSQELHKPVESDRLPIEQIEFPEDPDHLLIQVGSRTYSLNLHSYVLGASEKLLGRAAALSPEGAPRASRANGPETTLTFQNHTGGEISLTWVDTDGLPHDYGAMKAGEERELHTYSGHLWMVKNSAGMPLSLFLASDTPTIAVVEGPLPAPARPSGPEAEGVVSPNGKWRLLIRDHNLFLVNTEDGKESKLTHDGSSGDSYEPRIEWSPDSTRAVVFKIVPAQEHEVYYVESSPADQVQPKLHHYDYLKPGDRVEHPRPHLFDIASQREIPISDDLFRNPWLIDNVHWDPDSRRFTFLYNQRGHQVMRLIAVDAGTGAARTVIDEEAKTFIDWTNKVYLYRLDTTQEAIWMSERDGWNQLYLYDTESGKVKNAITHGDWVVRAVDRVDDEKRQIWFRAGGLYPEQDPYYVHYCRVNFDGTGFTRLTDGDGTHTVTFSPDERYLVDQYSRVDLPPVTDLRRCEDGKKLIDLEHGDASELLATGWRFPERFSAKGRDGQTDIYGVIFRPSHFDPAQKYPVVENIYAGPQGSFVPKAFDPAANSQQMAELGFIVVQIDGMGTNNRSKAFQDVCWKNLSDGGAPDRIAWIKAAAAQHPEMDLSRIGIYGTSAGGQNALAAMLLHPDFYRVGVADCGCHDNRMDKIWWNEQWMGWPVGPEYAANSNVNLAPHLQGKLLLMVGEEDRNVDPASTMQVVNALVKADKDFELLVMPGAGHGVARTDYGRRRLQDFLVRNLLHVEPRQ